MWTSENRARYDRSRLRYPSDLTDEISKLPIADKLKVRSKDDIQKIYLFLGASLVKNEPIKELLDPQVAGNIWKQMVAIADKYYQPGKFTTFAAYEWTSTPNNRNMHRNVIFEDTKKVPGIPFSSLDSTHPEDLWAWMDVQRRAGRGRWPAYDLAHRWQAARSRADRRPATPRRRRRCAIRDPRWPHRHDARRLPVRGDRLSIGRQAGRRTEQRVRLRQL